MLTFGQAVTNVLQALSVLMNLFAHTRFILYQTLGCTHRGTPSKIQMCGSSAGPIPLPSEFTAAGEENGLFALRKVMEKQCITLLVLENIGNIFVREYRKYFISTSVGSQESYPGRAQMMMNVIFLSRGFIIFLVSSWKGTGC